LRNNVNVQVYTSCNCDCKFCHFADRNNIKINPQFVLDYLNENGHVIDVVLTGGEPTFAIDECVEIIKGLKETNRVVTLQTNGWWGENEKIKTALKENPPSIVHLSVDNEKQKTIPIETVLKAHRFLVENGIKTFVVNHTLRDDNDEHNYYKSLFDDLKYGRIVYDNGTDLNDCGVALLAVNKVGRLNIKGWVM